MADLPARRVIRALERAGFALVRQRGSHRVYRHADGRQMTFAYHDTVRLGTTAPSFAKASEGMHSRNHDQDR